MPVMHDRGNSPIRPPDGAVCVSKLKPPLTLISVVSNVICISGIEREDMFV